MRQVLYALVPAVLVYIVLFGFAIVVQLIIAITMAILCEACALRLRGLASKPYLADGSVVVLACLLALTIPPYAPWWIGAVGIAFAVFLGKHAFGGLGHNVFNPAMVGYLFLLLCFPLTLSQWPEIGHLADSPGLWDSIRMIFLSLPGEVDAISGATALDHGKTQMALMRGHAEMQDAGVLGILGGRGWEWINIAYLVGGGCLLWRRVIAWRLPFAYLAGLAVAALIAHVADPELHRPVVFHLFTGGAMLAAFFIVTDPVSSATTPRGMLLFGFGAGLLTYLIREFGAYTDGVAFAIVIMNALAPLIDRFTQPSRYGRTTKTNDSSTTTWR